MHALDVIPDQWEKPKRLDIPGYMFGLALRLPSGLFFASSSFSWFSAVVLSASAGSTPSPPNRLSALGKTEGQVPSKRRYRRHVTMLRSQGISLAPQ